MKTTAQALEAKETFDKRLLKSQNVVGTAIGQKMVDGLPTGQPAVLVFVEKKMSERGILSKYSEKDIIPKHLDGIITDVIEVGKLVKQTDTIEIRKLAKQSGYKTKIRPICPGYSCGHGNITAGTIGGFFTDNDGDIVALSNNHVMACFDELTEVLTIDGWKRWDDITIDDQLATLNTATNELEYQYPKTLHKYFYNGELIRFQSKHIDQMVTPNHRLYCREDYKNNTKHSTWQFKQADEAIICGNKTIRFMRTADWHCATEEEVLIKIDININNLEAWVEFLGMFLTEGSTTYSPEYYNKYGKRKRGEEFITQIRNLDNKFLEDCKLLLDKLGFHSFINYKSHYCRSYDKRLYEYLKRFGKAGNKFIPTEIKQLQRKYLKILLLSLSRGDGCLCGHKLKSNHAFTLKSKRLIDDIQEIAIKLGGCATVVPKNGSTFCPTGKYWHCEVFWTNLEPKVRSISKIQYNGMVYCATVPNSTLLVRRNGKPCWSGNCENNAKAGDLIFQPGPIDSRSDKTFKGWDDMANILYFAILKKFVKINASNNVQDSAIATIHKSYLSSGMTINTYPTIGKTLVGWKDTKIGDSVQKCGRTTGYTTGKVIGLHATFTIGYDMGAIKFNNCIVLTPMSDGGDSGSIIADLDMNAVGLLFAGSSKVTIANPIIPIRDHYGLSLWDGTTKPSVTFGDMTLVTRHGKATYINEILEIEDAANHSCYIEKKVQTFDSIECIVNTGSDKGQTWGPGISISWPNGYLEVNLRYAGTFGGYYGNSFLLNIGKTKPDYDYQVRIIREGGRVKGEICDNDIWYTVIEIPDSLVGTPITVRFGKTDLWGGSGDYQDSGPTGKCSIRGIKIVGTAAVTVESDTIH